MLYTGEDRNVVIIPGKSELVICVDYFNELN